MFLSFINNKVFKQDREHFSSFRPKADPEDDLKSAQLTPASRGTSYSAYKENRSQAERGSHKNVLFVLIAQSGCLERTFLRVIVFDIATM